MDGKPPVHSLLAHRTETTASLVVLLIAVEMALSSDGVGPPPAQIRTGSATASYVADHTRCVRRARPDLREPREGNLPVATRPPNLL